MSKISSNTAAIGVKTGVVTLDFGAGDLSATIVVTGVPSVKADSVVSAQVRIEVTDDHSTDDLLVDPIKVTVTDIVAGVGFTINGRMFNARANGTYTINWLLS